MARKSTKPVTADEPEFSVDPKEAAKAIDAKNAKSEKKAPAARTDQKLIDRAVALRKEGLGLVKLTNKLTEEGFKSATGKELRPQTVRQLLLRALNTDHLRAEKPEQKVDVKAALEQSVEKAKPSRKRTTAKPKAEVKA
jgi:hypothetical protein